MANPVSGRQMCFSANFYLGKTQPSITSQYTDHSAPEVVFYKKGMTDKPPELGAHYNTNR